MKVTAAEWHAFMDEDWGRDWYVDLDEMLDCGHK